MKQKIAALLLALLLALSLTACRFDFELGGFTGGVHLELTQKEPAGWPVASPPGICDGLLFYAALLGAFLAALAKVCTPS